eukprot:GHVS01015168.1.p1 GENE.GHVS01015168.1~~GHVS01015168.1.p1  ORF type:complete len:112 (+),score=28.72 GHVS01015168.1:105-440(+)
MLMSMKSKKFRKNLIESFQKRDRLKLLMELFEHIKLVSEYQYLARKLKTPKIAAADCNKQLPSVLEEVNDEKDEEQERHNRVGEENQKNNEGQNRGEENNNHDSLLRHEKN